MEGLVQGGTGQKCPQNKLGKHWKFATFLTLSSTPALGLARHQNIWGKEAIYPYLMALRATWKLHCRHIPKQLHLRVFFFLCLTSYCHQDYSLHLVTRRIKGKENAAISEVVCKLHWSHSQLSMAARGQRKCTTRETSPFPISGCIWHSEENKDVPYF